MVVHKNTRHHTDCWVSYTEVYQFTFTTCICRYQLYSSLQFLQLLHWFTDINYTEVQKFTVSILITDINYTAVYKFTVTALIYWYQLHNSLQIYSYCMVYCIPITQKSRENTNIMCMSNEISFKSVHKKGWIDFSGIVQQRKMHLEVWILYVPSLHDSCGGH